MTDVTEQRKGEWNRKTKQSIISTRWKKIITHPSGCSPSRNSLLELSTGRKKTKTNNIRRLNDMERKREREIKRRVVILIYRLSVVVM